jgi:hypothetical protein
VRAPISIPRRRAIEDFAFDFARREDFFGQALQGGLGTKRKAERLHTRDQPALKMTNGPQTAFEIFAVPAELRPVFQLVDRGYSPHHLR